MNEQSYTKFLRNFYRTHCIYSSGAKKTLELSEYSQKIICKAEIVSNGENLSRERCCSTFETIAKSVFKEEKIEDAIVIFFSREKMIMPCDMNTHNLHTNSLQHI